MGFLDAITGGGGKSTSQSGFKTLPKVIKRPFLQLGGEVYDTLLGGTTRGDTSAADAMFRPMDATADELRAFDMMRTGIAPTQDSINTDMSMFMNPYQDSVINTINRQGSGDYSILKQALSEAGQMGSNRQILGANDIDLTRMDKIGSFLSDQFNTNLGYILNQIPELRMQDSANLLGIGGFQRELDLTQKQAPVSNLSAAASIMGALPQDGGTIQTAKGGSGGLLSALGSAGGLLSGIGAVTGFGAPTSGFTNAGWQNFLSSH